MVEFREFDEQEEDEVDLRVRIRKPSITEEERDQILKEFHAEFFGK